MHPFSILTLGIFVAGYITARWDLVTRLYELAIFAADHGVVVSLGNHIPFLGTHRSFWRLADTSGRRICSSLLGLLRSHLTN